MITADYDLETREYFDDLESRDYIEEAEAHELLDEYSDVKAP